MSHLVDMAKMADDVYEDANRSTMLGAWSIQDTINQQNLRIRAYKNTKSKTVVIAVRGTANKEDLIVSDIAGIGLGAGVLGLKLNDAINFTNDYAHSSNGVWFTGHSLGGAYVQLLSCFYDLPGITFNAPGAVAMINQMDGNPLVAAAGGLGSGAMEVLATILGRGVGDKIIDFITQAAAGASSNAYGPVANYRGNMDPVSKVGVHVGSPPITIQLASQKPHPHSMVPLISALEKY